MDAPQVGPVARWERWVLATILLLAAIFYAGDALGRHDRFFTSGFDLGIYGQAIWHWSRFEVAESTVRRFPNLFGDHFHPTLALYAPVFWIGDGLRNLLVAQVAVVLGAAFPIHAFARRRLGAYESLGIAGAYVVSWGVAQGLAFDVHDTSWSALALALTLYAFDRRSMRGFLAATVFLLLTREDQGLALAGIGVAALLLRRYREGVLSLVGGLGWILLTTRAIIPHFAQAPYAYWYYGYLGPNLPSAILGGLRQPRLLALHLVLPVMKTKTLLKGLGAYAFLPLFSPLAMVCLPNVLALLLADSSIRWEARYHYWMPISAAAAIAAADGLGRLFARYGTPSPRVSAGFGLAFVAFSMITTSRTDGLGRGWQPRDEGNISAARRVLALIPPEASVSATNYALGHLGARKDVYILRWGGEFAYGLVPVRAEYVVVDPVSFQVHGGRRDLHPFADPDYELIADDGGWSLFRLRPGIIAAHGLQPLVSKERPEDFVRTPEPVPHPR